MGSKAKDCKRKKKSKTAEITESNDAMLALGIQFSSKLAAIVEIFFINTVSSPGLLATVINYIDSSQTATALFDNHYVQRVKKVCSATSPNLFMIVASRDSAFTLCQEVQGRRRATGSNLF